MDSHSGVGCYRCPRLFVDLVAFNVYNMKCSALLCMEILSPLISRV